ncbi:MAG: helix-turn-helix transcriptional regulator [Ilumatobacter sp.]|uniref:PadR family transcriptional regulator n=1 Tax=Ilumatobacter sp. TaxID=1967498 RepID=UPI00261EBEC0|nr:helix-turn-helix transcriptional regulator [Ilumatobacter sp.]MDJ0770532.1 helix-turn-helix transcriptional regulator [Ilumatobacter sp.]
MREPTFLILSALAGGPAHGYLVMQRVSELSEGRVQPRPGTLYAALDRMLDDGWLTVESEAVVEGRNRRTYALTAPGREALTAQLHRLEANVAAARRELGLRPA